MASGFCLKPPCLFDLLAARAVRIQVIDLVYARAQLFLVHNHFHGMASPFTLLAWDFYLCPLL